ncbi:nuclear pore complex assembly-domain-containing protein [Ampelomyces quisqualis]|uniref:Nuclear pore complex assembly-domain-containing protein n=1 Tax=Ampelomyces quisqualis TaxID=50730 RepID=A0A6A5R0L8_AMPQU|nr:nuclear pore complex assembly-domain-containing protein [Ampelomyces quisqualis]
MIDIEDFEAVFPDGVTYSHGIVSQIQEFQHALGGKTFFERLLAMLKIQSGRRAYPPKNTQQLHDLHKRIIAADTSLHNKHCLIFYLLKDLAPQHHRTTDLATGFALDVRLEKRFWTFIEGLWSLDHIEFRTAVEHLTHPSIIPTFPDEILLTLMKGRDNLGSIGVHKSTEDDMLPLAYYNCVKPPLEDPKTRDEFAKYLSGRNVTETYYWIRERPDHEHSHLLEILIEQTLERSAWAHDNTNVYPRQDKAVEFVSLPFSSEEEEFIEKFLTEGKGRTFRGAEDTVLMRQVAMGRLTEVANEAGTRGRRHDGVNWDLLKDGVGQGLGPRKDEQDFVV